MPTATLQRTRRATRRANAEGQLAVSFCDWCGESLTAANDRFIHVGGHHFCSENCASESGYTRCSHCGGFYDPTEQGIRIDGEGYCGIDCAEGAGNARCAECGAWHSRSHGSHIEAYETEMRIAQHFCSEDCALRMDAYRCEDCGQWYIGGANRTPTGHVCPDCARDHYNYCDCCGYHVDVDDWDDEYDRCTSCTERSDGGEHLHRYGFRPTIKFFGDTECDTYPYLGVELETDTSHEDGHAASQRRLAYCEAIAALDTKPRFWLTHDSSLFCGVEVTSHPMTLAEHIECGMWESIRDEAVAHGFSSHNNGRCGLHVHINRSFFGKSEKRQQVGGYNLAMLVSRFEKQLTQFSRRTDNGWCSYGLHAEYLDDKNRHTRSLGMFDKSRHMCEGKKYEHCQCVNFQHGATFELRIFRGTLRIQTLYATLAMAQGLARAAKLHGQTWCEGVAWSDLTQFILSDMDNASAKSALSEYMTERGVG